MMDTYSMEVNALKYNPNPTIVFSKKYIKMEFVKSIATKAVRVATKQRSASTVQTCTP